MFWSSTQVCPTGAFTNDGRQVTFRGNVGAPGTGSNGNAGPLAYTAAGAVPVDPAAESLKRQVRKIRIILVKHTVSITYTENTTNFFRGQIIEFPFWDKWTSLILRYSILFFLDFQQERYVKWAEQQIENGKRLQEKLAQNPNNGR